MYVNIGFLSLKEKVCHRRGSSVHLYLLDVCVCVSAAVIPLTVALLPQLWPDLFSN